MQYTQSTLPVGTINSRGTSPRTDIYGLGATFYTLLTGTTPTDAVSRLLRLNNNESDPLVPVNQIIPAVSMTMAQVIYRAMSIDSADRFSTIEEFRQALQQASEPSPTEQERPEIILASSNSLPVLSHEAERSTIESLPPHVSQQEQPQASLPKNWRMSLVTLLALFVTLLMSVGVGANLWSYIGGQQRPIIAVTLWAPQARDTSSSSTANATVQITPTFVPVSSSYPSLAKFYTGTIYNISLNVTTKLVLTAIQQQQGRFNGYFSGLGWSSSFKGTITPNQHIQFTVSGDAGQAPLFFEGLIHPDGNLAGSYCSSSQGGQCSTYGLWSVSPAR